MKDLTSSSLERQNILNNTYAISELQKVIGLKGVLIENEYRFTSQQLSSFFNISTKTISRYLSKYSNELRENGYKIITGEPLSVFKNTTGTDTNVPSRATSLGIFNFRAFLNLSMLLSESETAKELRKVILDVVIDVINKRTGGNTKYINFSDNSFLRNLYVNEQHRKQFTDALKDYVDMGNAKYAIYTNKIYQAIFKEKAQQYRSILKLPSKENVRDTMYSEIIILITSFEIGIADEIKNVFTTHNRKLSPFELDELINNFANKGYWEPLLHDARTKMASRDNLLRNAEHTNLVEYIGPVSQEDFDKFLNEKKELINEVAKKNKEVFKRLKEK